MLFLMKCRSRKVRETVTRFPGIPKDPGRLNFPGNFPTRESRISTLVMTVQCILGVPVGLFCAFWFTRENSVSRAKKH